MPLIIEGADQCGKTTLAHKLVELTSKTYPTFYAHMSRPPETWDYYDDYLLRAQMFAVQDRFHYGGLVYADVRRGGTKITSQMLRLLESHLDLQGTVRVVLTAEPDLLEKRVRASFVGKERKEMYDLPTILEVNRTFQELADGVRYKNCRPDFVIKLEDDHPFVMQSELEEIANEWLTRLSGCLGFDGGGIQKLPWRKC
jgi:thymidylate kinase